MSPQFAGKYFDVTVKFLAGGCAPVERAFKMLCSFDDPISDVTFNGMVVMKGVVLGSTRDGTEYRVIASLTEAGAEGLFVFVKGAEDVEDVEGLEGGEGKGQAAQEKAPAPKAA